MRITARFAVMVSVLAMTLATVPAAQALADAGPPLTAPATKLRHAVWCDPSVTRSSDKRAVLLVHGTGGAPEGYWDWNYQRALSHAGYGVCTVTVPGRETGDATVSAQYVAYAARYAYQRSGREIAMIGHSQGGSLAVWAAKFWPDVAAHTDDIVSLSGDFGGTALGNVACAASWCATVAWQAGIGSHFLHAVRTAPLPRGPSITSIYSRTDEVVFPQPAASTLPGAANLAVQQVCPGRVADHITMLGDAVGYALTLDALRHAGTAQPARVDRHAVCRRLFMPHTDLAKAGRALDTLAAFAGNVFLTQPKVTSEPPLPAYAAPYGGYRR